MKLSAELILTIIILIALLGPTVYLVTPSSDLYYRYTVARYILKDPGFLWRTVQPPQGVLAAHGLNYFDAPPLSELTYAATFALNMSPLFPAIISIIAAILLLYKIEPRAVPFMLLSFLFIRSAVWAFNDMFLIVLLLAIIYLFDRKPILAGLLAGLCPLIKATAILIPLAFIISLLIFKRRELFKRNFYRNPVFIAIFVTLLIAAIWPMRNFMLFGADPIALISSKTAVEFQRVEVWLQTGFQAAQPETYWWDTTGYYPLPIDLLFYIGLFFTVFNLWRFRIKRGIRTEVPKQSALNPAAAEIAKSWQFEINHIFILIFVATYFTAQALGLHILMTIRYYLPIFPLLAIQIARGIPKKYMRFAYAACLLIFVFFLLSLPKYAFNNFDASLDPVCEKVKSQIGEQPVYIKAFHNWFVIYKCDLNATIEADSKWTLDLYQGQLYITNLSQKV